MNFVFVCHIASPLLHGVHGLLIGKANVSVEGVGNEAEAVTVGDERDGVCSRSDGPDRVEIVQLFPRSSS